MKRKALYLFVMSFFICCAAIFTLKTEYVVGIMLILISVYLLLVALILHEHKKTEDMMSKLLSKVGKSSKEIITHLEQ